MFGGRRSAGVRRPVANHARRPAVPRAPVDRPVDLRTSHVICLLLVGQTRPPQTLLVLSQPVGEFIRLCEGALSPRNFIVSSLGS